MPDLIPIADLRRQYHALRAEIGAALEGVLESGHFINGPNVAALEREVASYIGTKYAVALNSGTDALHLALRALDVGPGDEVITTPFTFVATTEAIGLVGARPVFVDIDPQTYLIDPDAIEAAITPRTKAIIPVHLYGNVADMQRIGEIATEHGLAIVEDCAQSFGARRNGQLSGSFGDIGAFSFFPSKNLGAYGDGGIVTTDNEALAQRIRSLRAHGGRVKYHHEELGLNSRLDEMQAAILRCKLPHIDHWNDERREHAAWYGDHLVDVQLPVHDESVKHVYHQYTIAVEDREGVMRAMADAGVQTMVYYPVPLHLQAVHAGLDYRRGDFPHSEWASEHVLSLPMFPELTVAEQQRVAQALAAATRVPVAN